MRKTVLVLLLVSATVAAQKPTLTIEVSDDLLAAIDLRCPPQPGTANPQSLTTEANPQPSAADIAFTRVACVSRTVQNEFAQELVKVRLAKIAEVESKIKALNPAQCAKLAKDLGVEMSSLPCGGGNQ